MEGGFLLACHFDKNCVFHVDEPFVILHVVDESLNKVGELRLEDEQSAFFVVPVPSNRLPHENSITRTVHEPQ